MTDTIEIERSRSLMWGGAKGLGLNPRPDASLLELVGMIVRKGEESLRAASATATPAMALANEANLTAAAQIASSKCYGAGDTYDNHRAAMALHQQAAKSADDDGDTDTADIHRMLADLHRKKAGIPKTDADTAAVSNANLSAPAPSDDSDPETQSARTKEVYKRKMQDEMARNGGDTIKAHQTLKLLEPQLFEQMRTLSSKHHQQVVQANAQALQSTRNPLPSDAQQDEMGLSRDLPLNLLILAFKVAGYTSSSFDTEKAKKVFRALAESNSLYQTDPAACESMLAAACPVLSQKAGWLPPQSSANVYSRPMHKLENPFKVAWSQ